MRKTHAALRDGEVQWLHNSDESHVASFGRCDVSETLVVATNLSPQPLVGVVEAGRTLTRTLRRTRSRASPPRRWAPAISVCSGSNSSCAELHEYVCSGIGKRLLAIKIDT